jgi:hypothetical protein
MFKKILHGAALGTLLLFGANGCTSSASNTVSVKSSSDTAKNDAATNSASDAAKSNTASNIKNDAPVSANQTNPTLANRANDDSNGDADGRFEHIKSEYAAILKKYLKTKPDLYPAIEADYDRANPKLVAIRKENQRNHPYYVADDFNGDGQEDFAVILKSRTAKNTFRSAVFNGPLDRNNGTPAFSGASDHRFVFQLGDSPDMPPFYIGSYASDDGFILEASSKGYKVVSMLD